MHNHLSVLEAERTHRGTTFLKHDVLPTCGHSLGTDAFLCPYDEDLVLLCMPCAREHLLTHVPEYCEACGGPDVELLSRPQTEWSRPGVGLTITMPTAVVCRSCAIPLDSQEQQRHAAGKGVGARTLESTDAVQRVLYEDGVFRVEACSHVLDLARLPADDRDGLIYACGTHAPMGLLCPECWQRHMAAHHTYDKPVPTCDECGKEGEGFLNAGAYIPVTQPVKIKSSFINQGKGVLDGGRVRVEPAAYVCVDCRDATTTQGSPS